MTIRLVADRHIPLLSELFHDDVELKLLAPHEIANHLSHADGLIVRSQSKVTAEFLKGSSLRAIATPTSGIDHLDLAYLNAHNIAYYHAPGCNAFSVCQYVLASLAWLNTVCNWDPVSYRVAVIGVGHVGRLVVKSLQQLGFTVLQCDPLRSAEDTLFPHTPLKSISNCDLITLHVPLSTTGPYPTRHFLTADILDKQTKNCIVMNTSRGEVLHPDLIKHAHAQFICDVFPEEPRISKHFLQRALLTTPHIAGHAIESKWRGSLTIVRALCQHFGLSTERVDNFVWPLHEVQVKPHQTWQEMLLSVYNPYEDHLKLQSLMQLSESDLADAFLKLRQEYAVRYEWVPGIFDGGG